MNLPLTTFHTVRALSTAVHHPQFRLDPIPVRISLLEVILGSGYGRVSLFLGSPTG